MSLWTKKLLQVLPWNDFGEKNDKIIVNSCVSTEGNQCSLNAFSTQSVSFRLFFSKIGSTFFKQICGALISLYILWLIKFSFPIHFQNEYLMPFIFWNMCRSLILDVLFLKWDLSSDISEKLNWYRDCAFILYSLRSVCN